MLDEKIKAVMAATLAVDPSVIDESASPETVESWDSLRQMNLVLALEDEFSVRFPEEQIDRLVSFQLIRQALSELLPDA